MRRFLITSIAALALASTAIAQIATPTPPTAPTVAAPVMTQGGQSIPAAAPNITQQLQNLLANPKAQQMLGQAMVMGNLLTCTEKQAGKDATQAYYQQMQQVGKTAEGYCKQGNAPAARTLVLTTLDTKHNDPVTLSALNCYDTQQQTIQSTASPQMAADMAHYSRWARDPALARQEMTDGDICKPKK